MTRDIPLKIEILSEGQDSQHCITSANEIEFVMRHIAEKGTLVALYYDNSNEFILTTLLGADDTGLWLEQSPNDKENQRLAQSHKLIFVSTHIQVKVQFTADHASSTSYKGYPAFFLPLPAQLYRMQRREYFRLMTPVTNPPLCIIDTGKKTTKNMQQEFTIMDISCGGIGLICTECDTELNPGTSYQNCQIELPDVGTIRGTIEVKNLIILMSESGNTTKRAGCEFKGLDGASTILLQRYVTLNQRITAKT